MLRELNSIIENFELEDVEEFEVIQSGLMHSTYKVHTADATYILQRLHHKLSTQEILDDYVKVTGHLNQKGFLAPRIYPTKYGAYVFVDHEDRWWRLTSCLPGETYERVSSVELANEGAKILGQFHQGMDDFSHAFKSTHPLHDTEGHLSGLRAALKDPAYEQYWALVADVSDEIDKLMVTVKLPDDLPQRVVHGDPKISNVMFSGTSALGMIDLDTCNRHTVLVDLGDAIRSWCRDGYEDEVQRFHLDRFEGILQGYADSGASLNADEIASLWKAGPMITLELASRFARDVLEDSYFAFDAEQYSSRRAHNMARMKSMLFLAKDMISQRESMQSIINKYFPINER